MTIEDRFAIRAIHPDMAISAASLAISYRNVAKGIDASIPDGRMKALALTELEASFNWAMRALADASWAEQ